MPGTELAITWKSFSYYQRLARVRSYVKEHLSDAITLEEAASIAALVGASGIVYAIVVRSR